MPHTVGTPEKRKTRARILQARRWHYPLITNCEDLTPSDILPRHKYQPTLEKRHEQLKSVYAVAPAFLKNEGRIDALLLLYYMALLIQALVERQLRRGMKRQEIEDIPLYPEERECRAPTARRVFEVFANLQRHELWEAGALRRSFEPELTAIQRQVLELLDVPEAVFTARKRRQHA